MIKNKRYSWLLVGLLSIVALLNYLDRQMLSTLRPAMQQDIEALRSARNFGSLMSVFLWVYGCMSPIAGWIADRVNRKWLIVASLFVWSAVVLAMGFTKDFHHLYALRALMGVSEALYLPAALSLIADAHGPSSRSLAIGVHMTGLYIGQALGGFGATIAGRWSWQLCFRGFGLVGIAYALVLIGLLRESRKPTPIPPPGHSPRSNRAPRSIALALFQNRSYLVILVCFMLLSLPGWAAKNWLPTLFASSLNLDMTVAGPMSTITMAMASLLGVLSGGAVSDRWALKQPKGRVFTNCIGLGLMIPALLLIGFGHSVFTVVLAALGFGLGMGMTDANQMPVLCQFVPQDRRATAYGLMNMAGVFAGALVTEILGGLTDGGHLAVSFSLMAGVVLAALLLQLIFLQPNTMNDRNG